MFEFDKLCREVEKMDPLTYSIAIAERSARVIRALSEITESELSGLTIYSGLILGAVVSDGKLAEEEFLLIKPMLDLAAEKDLSFEEAKALVKYLKPENKEYKIFVDSVVDLFGEIDEDLKTDIVSVCLLVCAIDGKISSKEKRWLKQLIKD